ncbi:MAG: cardiolipin synthase [Prevotella sp.]|nr:cardiolipin synthase [Prevotella sp.]
MEYLDKLIFLAYTTVVLITMLKVLLDNRQPAKTMAWLLVLIFIPLAGIILYFFFGQNTRKEKMISQHSMDELTKRSMLEFAEQQNLVLPKEHEVLIKLFTVQNWALPFKDNEAEIFTDGYSFIHALMREIAKAQHHIHFESYIICDDPLGFLVSDALINKSKQGVEVRLIYDDVGCWNVRNSFFERMRNAGIDVHSYMPVKFPAFTSKVNYRNHRKVCVIDGKVGFIGGMNIALRYVKGNNNGGWRDTHTLIRGGAVYGIQRAFLVDWYFVDRTLITNRCYYPDLVGVKLNNCIMQIVTGNPIGPWPEIMQGYVRILLEAKHYVYMETPYFLPTEPVMFAMRTAALAGVDVRLMIPLHSDSKLVEWASRSFVKESAEAGVKVYLFNAGFNHSKLLVCDDSLSTCGSTNIDFRSFDNNFEINAFIYDHDMALRIKEIFLNDMEKCVDYRQYSNKHRFPFLLRLWESLIRLFAPLL